MMSSTNPDNPEEGVEVVSDRSTFESTTSRKRGLSNSTDSKRKKRAQDSLKLFGQCQQLPSSVNSSTDKHGDKSLGEQDSASKDATNILNKRAVVVIKKLDDEYVQAVLGLSTSSSSNSEQKNFHHNRASVEKSCKPKTARKWTCTSRDVVKSTSCKRKKDGMPESQVQQTRNFKCRKLSDQNTQKKSVVVHLERLSESYITKVIKKTESSEQREQLANTGKSPHLENEVKGKVKYSLCACDDNDVSKAKLPEFEGKRVNAKHISLEQVFEKKPVVLIKKLDSKYLDSILNKDASFFQEVSEQRAQPQYQDENASVKTTWVVKLVYGVSRAIKLAEWVCQESITKGNRLLTADSSSMIGILANPLPLEQSIISEIKKKLKYIKRKNVPEKPSPDEEEKLITVLIKNSHINIKRILIDDSSKIAVPTSEKDSEDDISEDDCSGNDCLEDCRNQGLVYPHFEDLSSDESENEDSQSPACPPTSHAELLVQGQTVMFLQSVRIFQSVVVPRPQPLWVGCEQNVNCMHNIYSNNTNAYTCSNNSYTYAYVNDRKIYSYCNNTCGGNFNTYLCNNNSYTYRNYSNASSNNGDQTDSPALQKRDRLCDVGEHCNDTDLVFEDVLAVCESSLEFEKPELASDINELISIYLFNDDSSVNLADEFNNFPDPLNSTEQEIELNFYKELKGVNANNDSGCANTVERSSDENMQSLSMHNQYFKLAVGNGANSLSMYSRHVELAVRNGVDLLSVHNQHVELAVENGANSLSMYNQHVELAVENGANSLSVHNQHVELALENEANSFSTPNDHNYSKNFSAFDEPST